jgi:hypothetical protein
MIGAAAFSNALWVRLKMTMPGAMNWTRVTPGAISPRPPSARLNTARNSRLETAGPPIDSTP